VGLKATDTIGGKRNANKLKKKNIWKKLKGMIAVAQ
jgi:hypothetical protein